MPLKYEITSFSFKELCEKKNSLGERVLRIVEKIASELRKNAINPGQDYLRDQLDYQQLIYCDYTVLPSFGRVFLARDIAENDDIGFMLCFDDCFKKSAKKRYLPVGRNKFPISHCNTFFKHDIPFLRDLDGLNKFAYCFQIGVNANYQRKGCAGQLLDEFELFYHNQVVFLAASIHEEQKNIIDKLKQRNQLQLPRHPKTGKDYSYLFLDHYFDPVDEESHWFRVIQVLDNRQFVKRINYRYLPKAYNTIIPIQLNQAVTNVNKIIEHLDAKILWSSFFNASNLLQGRYSIGKNNHGFFESLLEANSEQYNKCTNLLQKITKYLQDKDSPTFKVVSLTNSFKSSSYELFCFNDREHEMSSFNNPLTLSLSDLDGALQKLLSSQSLQQGGMLKKMEVNEMQQWQNEVKKAIANPSQESLNQWQEWQENLLLSAEEIEIIEKGIQFDYRARSIERKDIAFEELMVYKRLIKKINKRKVLDNELKALWKEYFSLHRVMYEIDSTVLDNPSDYWWCHAMVPINYSRRENMVGIMFSFRVKKLSKTHREYKTRMNNLAYLITSALSKNILNILIKFQDNYAIESSNRYVIAAVTSRNLAHNLGSHILPNLDTEEAINELMEEVIPDSFAEEIARFHSFIRTRTNLLADMVTSEPVSTVSKWLNKEVIQEFNKLWIVKRFISGTHIKKVRVFYRDPRGGDDIRIQVPNGDLGIGAFFMILENIIRNSAKYETTDHLDTLDLTVELESSNERGYYFLLYDLIKREESKLNELVKIVNSNLETRSHRLGNNIRSAGWGLTEMKAAAAYLRKKVPGIIIGLQKDLLNIKFIEALSYSLPKTKMNEGLPSRTLAYRIYLKRPRNVILTNYQEIFSGVPTNNLIEQGIKIITEEELIKNEKKVHSHSFIIYFDQKSRKLIEDNKRFPLRWILLNGKEEALKVRRYLEKEPAEYFLNRLWSIWLEAYCERKGISYSALKLVFLDKKTLQAFNLDESQPLENLIVFDSHGHYLPPFLQQRKNELGFYQGYSSVDHTGRILNNIRSLNKVQKEIFKLQFLEAAVTRIVVVDERIQQDILRISRKKYNDLFIDLERMLIHIPNSKNGDPDLFSQVNEEAVAEWLGVMLCRHNIDFVVLHLGLLESWLGSDMEKISEWIEKTILLIDKRPEIILISGRGKPQQFPSSASYQPANTISEYIVGGPPSKFHLVQVLFSSRTRVGI